MLEARRRGIPITIHRPGRITGDAHTGLCNRDDFLFRMIKGCLQLHCYPEIRWQEKCAPVDWTAAAIVLLSTQRRSLVNGNGGLNFHLVSQEPFLWRDMFRWVGECDWNRPLLTQLAQASNTPASQIAAADAQLVRLHELGQQWKEVSFEAWDELLGKSGGVGDTDENVQNAMYALRPLLKEVSADNSMPSFSCTNTYDLLRSTTLSCPPMDRLLLHTYLKAQQDWFLER